MIHDLGTVQYTWIVADAHCREALATLRALARATARHQVYALRHLLPRVRLGQSRR